MCRYDMSKLKRQLRHGDVHESWPTSENIAERKCVCIHIYTYEFIYMHMNINVGVFI